MAQAPQMFQDFMRRQPGFIQALLSMPQVQEAAGQLLGQVCASGGYVLPAAAGTPVMTPAQVPGTTPGFPPPPALPPGPNSGCSSGSCGIPKPDKPGDCGCNGGGGKPPNDWQPVPSDACGLPQISPTAAQQLGTWNCITVRPDLAPCDVKRIMREEKLPTVIDTLNGALAINAEIAVEFAPIGVSHDLCIDFVKVEYTNAADPPETITVEIPVISLQPELLTQDPKGIYDHNWDYGEPERPEYLGITDGRCRCETLCVCVSAYGHARLVFTLPIALPANTNVKVTVWGRRKNWMRVCGPCPPCDVCERDALTEAEEVAGVDQVYVIQ